MAGVFGVIGATLCGIDLFEVVNVYVLPIMGGGNGAGAIPLSEMWEQTTGQSKESYYSMAFAILNIANNFAILGAVALNTLGEKFPSLSGNGELLKNAAKYELAEDKAEKPEIGASDMAGGLMLTGGIFVLSTLFADKLLPNIGSVTLHMYAYMVIFSAVFNVCNFVPYSAKEGAKRLSAFFTKPLMCMCMCGIGIAFTDLGEFVAVLNLKTIFICFLVVLGAILGAGFVGSLFGFYFVESAMTAGLCMANRGGSGDLQVLGAGKRMNLMSYAQISSRIGGAIILLIASVVFSYVK
jgi:Na+/citrate or Na+/malate symporter